MVNVWSFTKRIIFKTMTKLKQVHDGIHDSFAHRSLIYTRMALESFMNKQHNVFMPGFVEKCKVNCVI